MSPLNSKDLPNFHQVSDNFFRGGQPTIDGIKQLADFGIKTILNFRDPGGKVRREKKLPNNSGSNFSIRI